MLVDLNLNLDDLLALKGTPLPQDAAFDELRLKDVPERHDARGRATSIDPLVHYAGRVDVDFTDKPGRRPLEGPAASSSTAARRSVTVARTASSGSTTARGCSRSTPPPPRASAATSRRPARCELADLTIDVAAWSSATSSR